MEEQSWKIVIWATLFTLVVLAFAYFLIAPRESPYVEVEREKSAEFKTVYVTGRKQGKKAWEFYAQEGWSTENQEITYLINVSQGNIYKDGKLIVKDLVAKRAQAYRGSNKIEAFSDEKDPLIAYIDLGKVSDKKESKWVKLSADSLKYFEKEEESSALGRVKVTKEDSQIYADKIYIDHDKKIARIEGKVSLDRKDGKLFADKMDYFGQTEELIATGQVVFELKETTIRCEKAILSPDTHKAVQMEGNLEVKQKKKISVADRGTYFSDHNQLSLSGKINCIIEKGEAILKEGTILKLRNPEAKEILREKMLMSAEELVISTKSGDAEAKGSVIVAQKEKEAKANQAFYNDKEETITLTGHASLKKKDKWVKCEKVKISVQNETFEALGSVEAGFKL